MTRNFKVTLSIIGLLVAILIVMGLWIKHHTNETNPQKQVTLPAKDKERIAYNENRHTLTVTTPTGTTTTYSRDPIIDIQKDGTVKVDADDWGLEADPFLGVGYQDIGRVYLGVYGFYYKRFDLFSAIGFPLEKGQLAVQPLSGVSWNFYRHTSISVGINPFNAILREKPEFGVLLSVRA